MCELLEYCSVLSESHSCVPASEQCHMRYRCVNCENCGAPLEVATRLQRKRCDYCRSLGDASDLETLRWRMRNVTFQLELDLLDRQWLLEREQLMVRDASGALTVPSQKRLVLIAAIVFPACAAWIVGFLLVRSGASVLGVLVATPVGAWIGIRYSQIHRYRKRRAEYDATRIALCDRYLHGDSQQDVALPPDLSACESSSPLLPENDRASRDASHSEIADLDRNLEQMRLEGELRRLELDFERFQQRIAHQTVDAREFSDLKTHSTAVSPFVSVCAAVVFVGLFGGWGLFATTAFAVAAFIVEVRIRNLLLERESSSRRNHYESERRRLLSQIEIHQRAS